MDKLTVLADVSCFQTINHRLVAATALICFTEIISLGFTQGQVPAILSDVDFIVFYLVKLTSRKLRLQLVGKQKPLLLLIVFLLMQF